MYVKVFRKYNGHISSSIENVEFIEPGKEIEDYLLDELEGFLDEEILMGVSVGVLLLDDYISAGFEEYKCGDFGFIEELLHTDNMQELMDEDDLNLEDAIIEITKNYQFNYINPVISIELPCPALCLMPETDWLRPDGDVIGDIIRGIGYKCAAEHLGVDFNNDTWRSNTIDSWINKKAPIPYESWVILAELLGYSNIANQAWDSKFWSEITV